MTNVPDNLREMWKDVYVLFDTHFLMDTNNQDEWNAFWAEAMKINEKHFEIPCVIDLLSTVSEIISHYSVKRCRREKSKNED